jgi:hypothetical protein
MSSPGYRRLFVMLCSGCVLATILFGIAAARRSRPSTGVAILSGASSNHSSLAKLEEVPRPATNPRQQAAKATTPLSAPSKPTSHRLYFRTNALGGNYGKLTVAPIDALDRPQYAAELSCDRIHFAGGQGVCLASDRGVFTTYFAVMFDDHLRPGRTIPLNGIPSRARVSPSGRLAAITVFLSGQSYASLDFSTQTTIVDPVRGEVLADLESFSVSRDGAVFQSPDFNFWGVTFAKDENRFYATLWSKGKTYLVEGDIAKRSARVIYEGVECPSLSPDNTRIVFKKRVGSSRTAWRIHLLDLETLTETALNETRSVDDQMEWLDNEQVLYALSESEAGSSASTDIWVLPAGTRGIPQLLLRGAFSPAVF